MIIFNLKRLFNVPIDRINKIYFMFIWIIRALLLSVLIIEIYYGRLELIFITGLALFLTLLPYFFELKYQIKMPPEFHVFIVILTYASIYLGEIQDFYSKFIWWDTMLHTISGFVLGIIGFSIMFILYKGDKIRASPSAVSFFAFCFSLMLSVIWEIFEFFMDITFGMNMQKINIGTGVTDTMIDLIVNAIGALFASLIGFFYLKYGKSRIYKKILDYFIKENPKLFKKQNN